MGQEALHEQTGRQEQSSEPAQCAACELLQSATRENEALKAKVAELALELEAIKGTARKTIIERFCEKSERSLSGSESEGEAAPPSQGQSSEPGPDAEAYAEAYIKEDPSKAKAKPHSRRVYDGENKIVVELNDPPVCPECGVAWVDSGLPPTITYADDVRIEILHLEIRQHKHKPGCDCGCAGQTSLMLAPKPPSLVPAIYKSKYLNGFWAFSLYMKYGCYMPVYRTSRNMLAFIGGGQVSASTMQGGMKALLELLWPLYEAIAAYIAQSSRVNADETRWRIMDGIDYGKKTKNWWMWIFADKQCAVFVLDLSRSAAVPERILAGANGMSLTVDRYAAYKALAKDGSVTLAFCWLHSRRDFIDLCKAHPQLAAWAGLIIRSINDLMKLNAKRLEAIAEGVPDKIALLQERVENTAEGMFGYTADLLSDGRPMLGRQKKALESFIRHKDGLMQFVWDPLLPMSNNHAEQLLRGVALARNNYLGARAEWSGHLAACSMTIIKTAELNGLNPFAYIKLCLDECSKNASSPLTAEQAEALLPWRLSEEAIQASSLRSG